MESTLIKFCFVLYLHVSRMATNSMRTMWWKNEKLVESEPETKLFIHNIISDSLLPYSSRRQPYKRGLLNNLLVLLSTRSTSLILVANNEQSFMISSCLTSINAENGEYLKIEKHRYSISASNVSGSTPQMWTEVKTFNNNEICSINLKWLCVFSSLI